MSDLMKNKCPNCGNEFDVNLVCVLIAVIWYHLI